LPGPAGEIEAAIDSASAAPAAAPVAIAVLCHPHPLQQGTMQNKVVTTLARAFVRLGATAVRFNFRGVGGSAGVHAKASASATTRSPRCAGRENAGPGCRCISADFRSARRCARRGRDSRAAGSSRSCRRRSVVWSFAAPRCRWLLVHGAADDVKPAAPVSWAKVLPAPELVARRRRPFFTGNCARSRMVTRFLAADFGGGGGIVLKALNDLLERALAGTADAQPEDREHALRLRPRCCSEVARADYAEDLSEDRATSR
jgi:alpha/beta superfamily hydrolase